MMSIQNNQFSIYISHLNRSQGVKSFFTDFLFKPLHFTA